MHESRAQLRIWIDFRTDLALTGRNDFGDVLPAVVVTEAAKNPHPRLRRVCGTRPLLIEGHYGLAGSLGIGLASPFSILKVIESTVCVDPLASSTKTLPVALSFRLGTS